MKMTPVNWLVLGAIGVGGWWLYKKSQNGNGNGLDTCARALTSIPAGMRPPPEVIPTAQWNEMYLRHCRAAGERQSCLTSPMEEPPPECLPVLNPMMDEMMAVMTSRMSPEEQAMQAALTQSETMAYEAERVARPPGIPSGPLPPEGMPMMMPMPGTAPMPMRPGEMTVMPAEAIAENTTATSGLGYTGGMFSRHLFAGMR
jgi:hypothetical protein